MKDIDRKRQKRKKRIRKKVIGTYQRPRLSVHKSLKNTYAQIINDVQAKTLLLVSTLDKRIRNNSLNKANKTQKALLLGEILAQEAVEKGIKKVVFDRSGYPYHGRIKAFAESCRKHGLEF